MTIAAQLLKKGVKKGEEKAHTLTIMKLYTISYYSVDQIVDFLEIDRTFVVNTLKAKGLIK